jgi:predicted dehydrogenase
MTDQIRYGVVGCGNLGRIHAEKLASITAATLTGVFDVIPEKTIATATANHCRACTSIEELLDSVDAVSIVVPTESHHAEAMRALLAGKHVLVEKPIAITEAEGLELTDLAANRGLKLQVGHIERFNPACAGLGLLPEPPRFIEGHRLSQFSPRGLGVPVILELMIHDLDLILSVVKSPVREVHASAVAVISEQPDIANARIEFANGTVANLTASRISVQKMRKLRLFAKDNYLSIDLLKKSGEHFVLAPLDDTESYAGYFSALQHEPTGRKIMFRQLQYADYDMLTEEIRAFVDAIIHDGVIRVGGREATQALKLANQIEAIALENIRRMAP